MLVLVPSSSISRLANQGEALPYTDLSPPLPRNIEISFPIQLFFYTHSTYAPASELLVRAEPCKPS